LTSEIPPAVLKLPPFTMVSSSLANATGAPPLDVELDNARTWLQP
jgi:hypothetical protein